MIGATSKVATSKLSISKVRMEEEEAPAEAAKDSVLDGLSGLPAEVLDAVKGMTLLEARAPVESGRLAAPLLGSPGLLAAPPLGSAASTASFSGRAGLRSAWSARAALLPTRGYGLALLALRQGVRSRSP